MPIRDLFQELEGRQKLAGALKSHACQACEDSGLVLLKPLPRNGAELFAGRGVAPCVCDAGDQWRITFELANHPPPCVDCGKPATCCPIDFPKRWRCAPCEREWAKKYRGNWGSVPIASTCLNRGIC